MILPQDDYILLSFLNTKLRDEYPSFGGRGAVAHAENRPRLRRRAQSVYIKSYPQFYKTGVDKLKEKRKCICRNTI